MASASTETKMTTKQALAEAMKWNEQLQAQVKQLKEDLEFQKGICYQQGLDEAQTEVKELTEKLALYQGADIEANLAEIQALKEQVEKLTKTKDKKVKEKEEFSGTVQELITEKGMDWVKKHLTKDQFVESSMEPSKVFTITVGGSSKGPAKDRPVKSEDELTNSCCARVWNNWLGGQCHHPKKHGDYCKAHFNQFEKYDGLTHGDVRITGKGSIPHHKVFEGKLFGNEPFSNPHGVDVKFIGNGPKKVIPRKKKEESSD